MEARGAARGVHPTTGSFLVEGKLRRIGVIGPKCVGKSSLILRFSEDTFEEKYVPTIEADETQPDHLFNTFSFLKDLFLVSTSVDGTSFNCEILDSAGQDEVSSFGGQLTIGVHGHLIVFSVRDRESFDLVRHVNQNLLVSLGGGSGHTVPRVLVGNQTDVGSKREVSREEARKLSEELRMPYIECSALTGVGVDDSFHLLLRQIEGQGRGGLGAAGKNSQKKKCVIS